MRKTYLRMRVFVVIGAVLSLLVTTRASAQLSNPRVSAFGGVSLLGAQRTFVLGNDVVQTSYNNGAKFGLRGTVDFGSRWAGEVMYGFSGNDLRISSALAPQQREFGVHMHQFAANAVYFLASRESFLRPFGTVGIGFSRFNPTGDAQTMASQRFITQPTVITSENKPALNVGVGAEAKIRDLYGLRFDVRDYISGTPTFGLPESPANPGAAFYPVSGMLNRVELSGSVILYLANR